MLFLSAVSTSLLPFLYFVKSSFVLFHFNTIYDLYINLFIYFLIPFVLSALSLLLLETQQNDSIQNSVKEIRQVNHEYLPIYLGYIFVSLSLPNPKDGSIDVICLMIVYLIVVLFVTCSKSLCFNPIFVIFGYAYYRVVTKANVAVFIITRRKFNKSGKDVVFPNLKKISEFIFLEN